VVVDNTVGVVADIVHKVCFDIVVADILAEEIVLDTVVSDQVDL